MAALSLVAPTYLMPPYSASAASSTKVNAIQLKQMHYFLGPHLVTVAKDAVRVENTGRFKYIVVAKAPDWRINIFRNDDKTYFSESLQEFEETGLVSDFIVSRRSHFQNPKMLIKSSMVFLGRPIIRLTRNQSAYKRFTPGKKASLPQVELVSNT